MAVPYAIPPFARASSSLMDHRVFSHSSRWWPLGDGWSLQRFRRDPDGVARLPTRPRLFAGRDAPLPLGDDDVAGFVKLRETAILVDVQRLEWAEVENVKATGGASRAAIP